MMVFDQLREEHPIGAAILTVLTLLVVLFIVRQFVRGVKR